MNTDGISTAGTKVDWDAGTIEHPDFGDMTLDVIAALAEIERESRVEASVLRLQLAKDIAADGPRRNMEFGRVVAEITEQDYDDQERLEPGCWTDKGFIEEFVKLVPETKVESRSDKIVVGYKGETAH